MPSPFLSCPAVRQGTYIHTVACTIAPRCQDIRQGTEQTSRRLPCLPAPKLGTALHGTNLVSTNSAGTGYTTLPGSRLCCVQQANLPARTPGRSCQPQLCASGARHGSTCVRAPRTPLVFFGGACPWAPIPFIRSIPSFPSPVHLLPRCAGACRWRRPSKKPQRPSRFPPSLARAARQEEARPLPPSPQGSRALRSVLPRDASVPSCPRCPATHARQQGSKTPEPDVHSGLLALPPGDGPAAGRRPARRLVCYCLGTTRRQGMYLPGHFGAGHCGLVGCGLQAGGGATLAPQREYLGCCGCCCCCCRCWLWR